MPYLGSKSFRSINQNLFLSLYVAPRKFKLLMELEKGALGETGGISYNLSDAKDNTFANWDCSIIGPPGSALANRNVQLTMYCGENYPSEPPQVSFISKVLLPSVNKESGDVDVNAIMPKWDGGLKHGIEDILIMLRREMETQSNNYRQPEEDEEF